MPKEIPDKLLTPSAAVEYVAGKGLDMTMSTLRRWADRDLIPVLVLPSGQRRYRTSDLDALTQLSAA